MLKTTVDAELPMARLSLLAFDYNLVALLSDLSCMCVCMYVCLFYFVTFLKAFIVFSQYFLVRVTSPTSLVKEVINSISYNVLKCRLNKFYHQI